MGPGSCLRLALANSYLTPVLQPLFQCVHKVGAVLSPSLLSAIELWEGALGPLKPR